MPKSYAEHHQTHLQSSVRLRVRQSSSRNAECAERDAGRFDCHGSVRASLRPAIEWRPGAEDRDAGVEIDDDVRDALVAGDTLAGELILTGTERPTVSIRECKGDKGDNLHHGSLPPYTRDFPDLFVAHAVTAMFSAPPCPHGEIGGGR